jgi:protein transport protein HofC
VRSVLEKYQGLLLFEFLLAIFEAVLFSFGWLNAVLAVALVPASLALWFAARGLRDLVGETIGGKRLSLRFGMRHLMVFVCLTAVLFQLVRTLGWSLLWLIALALPPLVVAGVWLFIRSRGRTQQDGLVAVLGMAARRGLPLGPAVSAYAGLCEGRYRSRALSLADRLESGSSLPDALDALPGILPPDTAALARAGWDTNQFGPALAQAAESLRAQRRDAPSVRRTVSYPLFVLASVTMGATFMGFFITPKMRVILRDYGLAMPAPAQAAIQALDLLAMVFWMPVFLVLSAFKEVVEQFIAFSPIQSILFGVVASLVLIAGFLILCWWLVQVLNRALGNVIGIPTPDPIPRNRRGWRRSYSRDCSAVLRSLALGVESGLPMPDVLDRLAHSELGNRARWAVSGVRADIRAGRSWIASLALRKLIRPVDASVLTSAERVGNLAWALRERADALDRRRLLRLRTFAVILQPVTAVALGALVLLVALTYFLPLVAMIHAMVESV